jgi:hypothetical protein
LWDFQLRIPAADDRLRRRDAWLYWRLACFGWWARRKGGAAARPLALAGMTLGGGLALWLLSFAYTARTVPAIHDISTDLADPPQFRMLEVRADNLDQIPGENEPEMKGMNPQQRWAALHQKAMVTSVRSHRNRRLQK